MSSKKTTIDINSVIINEKKSMFLNPYDKCVIQKHVNNHQFTLDKIFDDKKIFYNSNIKIDTKV